MSRKVWGWHDSVVDFCPRNLIGAFQLVNQAERIRILCSTEDFEFVQDAFEAAVAKGKALHVSKTFRKFKVRVPNDFAVFENGDVMAVDGNGVMMPVAVGNLGRAVNGRVGNDERIRIHKEFHAQVLARTVLSNDNSERIF